MLTSFAKTHIGKRTTNEDSILVNEKLGLYIVADGVGEMGKGDLASKLACKKVMAGIKKGQKLEHSVFMAHGAIVDYIESHKKIKRMATTMAAVLFDGNNYDISWVGDTRVYLWDGKLKLLTRDDSHLEIYLEKGLIEVEDMANHPDRNFITQAMGMRRKEITVHSNKGTLEKDQILLICSDGLYEVADEVDISNELTFNQDMTKLTEKLVNLAVNKNGIDNISLVSIKCETMNSFNAEIITPHIVREFEADLNRVKEIDPSTLASADLDNVDITKLQHLTPEQIELLEKAALTAPKVESTDNNLNSNDNKLVIYITVTVILMILIAVILYFAL